MPRSTGSEDPAVTVAKFVHAQEGVLDVFLTHQDGAPVLVVLYDGEYQLQRPKGFPGTFFSIVLLKPYSPDAQLRLMSALVNNPSETLIGRLATLPPRSWKHFDPKRERFV